MSISIPSRNRLSFDCSMFPRTRHFARHVTCPSKLKLHRCSFSSWNIAAEETESENFPVFSVTISRQSQCVSGIDLYSEEDGEA
jgi:hypothetical protein